MKIRNLILAGALMVSTVVSTQAAVYGTLKQDIYVNVENDTIKKTSGTGVSILDQDVNNFLIKVSDDKTEYISKRMVELAGTITKTTVEGSKVSTKADPSSEVITTLKQGEMVMVLDKADNYYKVKVDDKIGYVYKSQIDTSNLAEFEKSSDDQLREDLVNYAKSYVGGRYQYGGNDLNKGVDCSGFVQQIMKRYGVSMERSSRAQYASNGVSVKESDLKPGDLVYYGNGGTVNHAAIYIGGGQIVHASDERTGITISNLHYGKPVIGMKRVL